MKNVISFGLGLVALTAFAACSSDSDDPAPTDMGNTDMGNMDMGNTDMDNMDMDNMDMDNMDMDTDGAFGDPLSFELNALDPEGVGSSDTYGIMGGLLPIENGEPDDGVDNSFFDSVTVTDGKICATGSVKEVINMEYDKYWGVQIDMFLNQQANETNDSLVDVMDGEAQAGWNPDNYGVLGFSFKFEGASVPPNMRFRTNNVAAGDQANFCFNMSPVDGGTVNVYFDDVVDKCWGDVADHDLDPPFTAIGWQLNSDPGVNYDFDFCISEVKPLLQ